MDLLASTVIDVAFRGAQFGEAFMRNVVASIGGSVVGEVIGAVGRSHATESFIARMLPSDAERYKKYWRSIEDRLFIRQMPLEDAMRYNKYWDEVAHNQARSIALREATQIRANLPARRWPTVVSVGVDKQTGEYFIGMSGRP